MRKLVFAVVAVAVALTACRSIQDVCKDTVAATRDKFHQCTPDAGDFGALIELSFASAEGQCATIDKGCQLPDGGTSGTYNAAAAEKCIADIKAASCADSNTTSANCASVCK